MLKWKQQTSEKHCQIKRFIDLFRKKTTVFPHKIIKPALLLLFFSGLKFLNAQDFDEDLQNSSWTSESWQSNYSNDYQPTYSSNWFSSSYEDYVAPGQFDNTSLDDFYSQPSSESNYQNHFNSSDDSQVHYYDVSTINEPNYSSSTAPLVHEITWKNSTTNHFKENDPGTPVSYAFDTSSKKNTSGSLPQQNAFESHREIAQLDANEILKEQNALKASPSTATVNRGPTPATQLNSLLKNSTTPIVPTTSSAESEITPITFSENATIAASTTSENDVGPINFNNVSMIEYIRFISRVTNKNFVFEEEDLQFNVTIISEKPTSIFNLMTALLQELRIRDLSLIEQGNSIIIHRNPRIRAPGTIIKAGAEINAQKTQIITRVFRLNTLDPSKVTEIIKPLLSDDALVEVLRDSNNLIITDLVANVDKIADLINSLDAPNSGVTVGQYAVKNGLVDSLVELASRIIFPIAQGNPFVLVPHSSSNSVYIVSNAFIVEKALAILQNLDHNDGKTKVFSLDKLQSNGQNNANNGMQIYDPNSGQYYSQFIDPDTNLAYPQLFDPETGKYTPQAYDINTGTFQPLVYDPATNKYIIPKFSDGPTGIFKALQFFDPLTRKYSDASYQNGGFNSARRSDADNRSVQNFSEGSIGVGPSVLNETSQFLPGGISAASRLAKDLPSGHIARTVFFIYKLKYRRGDQIETSIKKIALSLMTTGLSNIDLVSAINSVQWIESSNSLIFTGSAQALEKIKDLIVEIDIPLNQVYIEMLILDTTLEDSLTYGVDWGLLFGGGNTSGGESFTTGANGRNVLNGLSPNLNAVPDAKPLLNGEGFNLGIIGKHLTHNGTHFSTISALVKALHRSDKAHIILNPRILTEDNVTAEIFVGETDRYKTQSISNDLGNVITNNFEFIDVGTTLRVTPLIGNNGIITLDIIEEVTSPAPQANNSSDLSSRTDVNLVAVLLKNRSTTRIHVPNGFFVVMSGLIDTQDSCFKNEIPCLGMIPILGGGAKFQRKNDRKRNLMIFVRPVVVNTVCELEDITKRQQDVYRDKSRSLRAWNHEIDDALDFFNIKSNDPDEIGCRLK